MSHPKSTLQESLLNHINENPGAESKNVALHFREADGNHSKLTTAGASNCLSILKSKNLVFSMRVKMKTHWYAGSNPNTIVWRVQPGDIACSYYGGTVNT